MAEHWNRLGSVEAPLVGVLVYIRVLLVQAHTGKAPLAGVGRWLLAAAVLAGWGVGAVTAVGEAAVAALLAFLGGGVVLNVLR